MIGRTNATYNPYVPIYGFEIDTSISATPSNVSFSRDAYGMSFDRRAELYTKHFKPCVVSRTTGDVNYFLDPTDGTKKLDGTPANLDGTDGDVCVCIDTIWYRTSINGTKQTFEFAFRNPVAIGESGFDCWSHKYGDKTLPYIFAGMFKSTGSTSACYSVNSTAKPVRNMTMTQFETAYKATGASTPSQYIGLGLPEKSLIGMMLIFLSGSTNSQGFFGNGCVSQSEATNIGFNATSMLASGDTSSSSGVMSGYFNNLWGVAYEFTHQCMFNNYKVKTTYLHNDHVTDITSVSYSSLPSTWYESTSSVPSVSAANWTYTRSLMMTDAPCCTLPLTWGGSTETYLYDGVYINPSALTAQCLLSSGIYNGIRGAFSWAMDYGIGIASWDAGSRLLIRPIQLAK